MYNVVIREMSKAESPDEEWVAGEFDALDTAKEFARRWVRDSVEALRRPEQSPEELRKQWALFGDDAVVEGAGFSASSELDAFVATPATPEQRDWKALKNNAKS